MNMKEIVIQSPGELAQYIDHTLLSATATLNDVERICDEAIKYSFKTVCINPIYVKIAAQKLSGSNVLPITVVGFPLGANSTGIKAAETRKAVDHGAKEIDMVLGIGHLKSVNYTKTESDIKEVVKAADGLPVKVILETCLLTDQEKILACKMAMNAGAHFVKTSTGFGGGGATVHDVQLLRKTVGAALGVKASGGIRSYSDAMSMIKAGANRLGASAGIEIIKASVKSNVSGVNDKY